MELDEGCVIYVMQILSMNGSYLHRSLLSKYTAEKDGFQHSEIILSFMLNFRRERRNYYGSRQLLLLLDISLLISGPMPPKGRYLKVVA